jgi:hypothetical protein
MDGELLMSRIDGRSADVDPGMHEFVFSTEQGDVHSEKILILQGRNRVISVALKRAAAAPSESAHAPDATPPPPSAASTMPAVEQRASLAPATRRPEVATSESTDRPRTSPRLPILSASTRMRSLRSI